MNNLEELTKKFILVKMDEVQISTKEKPIIGTQGLATCTGLLLYCKDKQIAIVAHIGSDVKKIIDKVLDILENNNINFENIEYHIIPGYDRYDEERINAIIKYLKLGNVTRMLLNDFKPYKKNKIKHNSITLDTNTLSIQFAFDANLGIFVTDKVLFGTDYYMINQENNEYESNHKRNI